MRYAQGQSLRMSTFSLEQQKAHSNFYLLQTYDFLLSSDGRAVVEDLHPSPQKLAAVPDGYIIHNVTGIRAHIVTRLDGKGYDISKRMLQGPHIICSANGIFLVGPYSVKTGQIVYVNDSDLFISPQDSANPKREAKKRRVPEIALRLFLDNVDYVRKGMPDILTEVLVLASTATFGGDPTESDSPQGPIQFGHGTGVRLVRDESNVYGCSPYTQKFHGETVVVRRGECAFIEKLEEAALAGASGVVTLTDDDNGINPSAAIEDIQNLRTSLDDVAIVTISRPDSMLITAMLDSAELHGRDVLMTIASAGEASDNTHRPESAVPLDERRTKAREGNRVLYLNGHPLLNTRLML